MSPAEFFYFHARFYTSAAPLSFLRLLFEELYIARSPFSERTGCHNLCESKSCRIVVFNPLILIPLTTSLDLDFILLKLLLNLTLFKFPSLFFKLTHFSFSYLFNIILFRFHTFISSRSDFLFTSAAPALVVPRTCRYSAAGLANMRPF